MHLYRDWITHPGERSPNPLRLFFQAGIPQLPEAIANCWRSLSSADGAATFCDASFPAAAAFQGQPAPSAKDDLRSQRR